MSEYKVGDRVLVETNPMREATILKILTSTSDRKFYKLHIQGSIFSEEQWFAEDYIKGVIEP